MSLAAQAATTVVALVAAVTAVSLWRGANRHAGSVRRAYRFFALAALLWGAGAIGQQVLASASAGATFPFTGADLPGLLALPALVTGLVSLGSRREAARHPLAQRHRARIGTAVARCADGYVVASALFIIGWITVLSAGYVHSGDDPGTFAAELVHPLADLLVLGGVLPLAVAAGRRGVAPVLALLAVTASDMLAVGAKVSNGHPGAASQLLLIAGFLVLGCAPWMGGSWRAGPGDAGQFTRAGAHAATALAGVTAAAAALVLIGWVLAGSPAPEPVLALVTGTALLALTARVLILVHRDSIRSRLWHESGHQFRELADRISDVVLVCDYAGAISYASPAVRDYGYTPAGLEGQVLTDLVHPEDRLGGLRAVREAASVAGAPVTDGPGEQVRYSCRVRAADGTWRYVEATISRHRSQGAPDRLLVTSRDVSDQVALRRQIAHLTYHDGLTGLPNRAYLEEQAREVLSLERQGPGVAGVILVDLDAFTSVNDVAGPERGRSGSGPGGAAAAGRGAAARHGGPLGRRRVRGPDPGRCLGRGGHRAGPAHPGQRGRRTVPRRRPQRGPVRQRRSRARGRQPGRVRLAQRRRRGVPGQGVRRRAAGGLPFRAAPGRPAAPEPRGAAGPGSRSWPVRGGPVRRGPVRRGPVCRGPVGGPVGGPVRRTSLRRTRRAQPRWRWSTGPSPTWPAPASSAPRRYPAGAERGATCRARSSWRRPRRPG